jgi:hypothetical protein
MCILVWSISFSKIAHINVILVNFEKSLDMYIMYLLNRVAYFVYWRSWQYVLRIYKWMEWSPNNISIYLGYSLPKLPVQCKILFIPDNPLPIFCVTQSLIRLFSNKNPLAICKYWWTTYSLVINVSVIFPAHYFVGIHQKYFNLIYIISYFTNKIFS